MRDREDYLPELDLTGSLTVESVRRWRAQVDTFFAQRWEPLRALIRRLEEDGIRDGAVSDAIEQGGSRSASPDHDASSETARQAVRSVETDVVPHAVRLTELSRKLNEKLVPGQAEPNPLQHL